MESKVETTSAIWRWNQAMWFPIQFQFKGIFQLKCSWLKSHPMTSDYPSWNFQKNWIAKHLIINLTQIMFWFFFSRRSNERKRYIDIITIGMFIMGPPIQVGKSNKIWLKNHIDCTFTSWKFSAICQPKIVNKWTK